MILSPYFWIGLLAAALALGSVSYYYGGKHARDAVKAGQFSALSDAVGKAIEKMGAAAEKLDKYEAEREKVRVVYRTVKEKADVNIAQNPGYECSLDADGLRLYNTQPAAAGPSVPDADQAVPGSAAGTGREVIHDSEEQHRES